REALSIFPSTLLPPIARKPFLMSSWQRECDHLIADLRREQRVAARAKHDILLAFVGIGCRYGHGGCIHLRLPQHVSGLEIDGAHAGIHRSTDEYEAAFGDDRRADGDRSPCFRHIEAPELDLAK